MAPQCGGVRGRPRAPSGLDRCGSRRRSWSFAAASLLVSIGAGRLGVPAFRSFAGARLPVDPHRTTADSSGRRAFGLGESPSTGIPTYRVVNLSRT